MSKAVSSISSLGAQVIAPFSGAAQAIGLLKKKPEGGANSAPAPIEERVKDKQVENRRDERGAIAAATSTQELDSDYYLLGHGGPKPKARGVSRQLLGE